MGWQVERFKDTFIEEVNELLEKLETALLELEQRPEDGQLVNDIFGVMHTIKGSAAMFGFDNISTLTHKAEDIYDRIRNKQLSLNKELVDLTLQIKDTIRLMLNEDEEKKQTNLQGQSETKLLAEHLSTLLGKYLTTDGKQKIQQTKQDKPGDELTTFRIRFKPPKDIFLHGTNPVLLIKELQNLGQIAVFTHTSAIPELDAIGPEDCYTWWDILLTTRFNINTIKDIFIFVEWSSEIKIEPISSNLETGIEMEIEREVPYKRIGEILVERGDISTNELEAVLNRQPYLGEMLKEKKLVREEDLELALAEQAYMKKLKGTQLKDFESQSIRIHADKLDKLVNLVGELVTLQARFNQSALEDNNPFFMALAEESERLISELRDNTMSMRMLPIGTTFRKFSRLVRDLSRDLAKEVELTTEGAETEIDKTVIEKLNDPLIHLIRNAIDHGIEQPDERLAKGKQPAGRIQLTAQHAGANVIIQVSDDGRGLDREKIIERAKNKGLITPGSTLSEKEIFELILQPGFSTSDKITSVSGRGVGMDVVKKSIENLNGQLDIKSTKDKGTTIILKIPLTLAIIDGLLVRLDHNYFVIPLAYIEECLEYKPEHKTGTGKRHLINYRGEALPYVCLRDTFYTEGTRPPIEQVVIVSVHELKVGLVLDSIVGNYQTVIKPLSKVYRDSETISGATILGDGTVALILDIDKLVSTVEREETEAVALHLIKNNG